MGASQQQVISPLKAALQDLRHRQQPEGLISGSHEASANYVKLSLTMLNSTSALRSVRLLCSLRLA